MRYRTIVADPPWPQKGAARARGPHTPDRAILSQALPYETMSLADITALPVSQLANQDGCNLFLWTTSSMLPHVFAVITAWGFTYRQAITWRKTNPSPFAGTGSFAPLDVEYLLVARKGSARFSGRLDSSVVTTRATALRGQDGSKKPEAFADRIEQISPGPYLELFARRQRIGWDTWGDQALNHVEMPA